MEPFVAESSTCRIELECGLSVTLAMQQNDVPLLRRLRLESTGAAPLAGIEIRISAEPAFLKPWTRRLDRLAAGEPLTLTDLPLQLSPEYLLTRTERTSGLLHVEVVAGEQVIAREHRPVTVLAWNEWAGVGGLPELLAAFVMPNHPALLPLQREASALLAEHTGNGALDAYQSRSAERALAMAAAAYAAVQQQNLIYAVAPASFETRGQRVRLHDALLANKLGNCLDLSCLYAALLEQCGLHTLIVLTESHAFAGVWLQEESFAEPWAEDGLRLRKYAELGSLVLVELTVLPQGADFASAVRQGREQLDALDKFRGVLDVSRARAAGIRPLPLSATAADAVLPDAGAATTPGFVLPSLPTAPGEAGTPQTAATRLDLWKRKLLDLTLRNRLLNSTDTKKVVPLHCADLGELENELAADKVLKVLPEPAEFGRADPRSAALHQQRTGDAALPQVLAKALQAQRVHAALPEAELGARLLEIFRAARTHLEESGASGLYVALGFLKWYESPQSEKSRLAPLLLLPASLTRASVQEGFRLHKGADDTLVNVTLLEMLKQDFDIAVPGLDPLPVDASGVDVPQVLARFRAAVKDIPRWEVVTDCRLAFYSFSKFLLWRDLQERAAALMQNDLVRYLVTREGDPPSAGDAFPVAERLDADYRPQDLYCPLDADSSQLAAVLAAAEGRNFVLEGPPGTGKSQTIANIVAQCLATQRTVLFVAEKQAALNVVHERLKRCGLGDFCLELHSTKAEKRAVVGQLYRTLQLAPQADQPAWSLTATRLEVSRRKLNDYAAALHAPQADGTSVFQALSTLSAHAGAPAFRYAGALDGQPVAGGFEAVREAVRGLATSAVEGLAPATVAAFGACEGRPWSFAYQHETQRQLDAAVEALAPLRTAALALRPLLPADVESTFDWAALGAVDALAAELLRAPPSWPPVDAASVAAQEGGRASEQAVLHDGADSVQTLLTEQAQLAVHWQLPLPALDVPALQALLAQAAQTWFFPAWRLRRRVRAALQPAALVPLKADAATLAAALARLRQWQDGNRTVQVEQGAAAATLRAALRRYRQRFDAAVANLRWVEGVAAGAAAVAALPRGRRLPWQALLAANPRVFAAGQPLHAACVGYRTAFERFTAARRQLVAGLDARAGPCAADDGTLPAMAAELAGWQAQLPRLKAWCAWRQARRAVLPHGLLPLVRLLERGELPPQRVEDAFAHAWWQWWVEQALDASPVLAAFSSAEQARTLGTFRTADEAHRTLAPAAIRAQLTARLPPVRSVDPQLKKEMDVLAHEAGKKARHKAVRKLLQEMPTLLPRLAPCLLASPIAAAQYLDAARYDVVIFDEASQIPIWDAVGAMARGKQVVVVGDPKQLPPTNFFGRTDLGESDTDAATGSDGAQVEDLESMLDDCIAARLPWLTLDWHYRSRHESLITFSNRQYYAGRLLTFPSADAGDLGVKWVPVEGVYDRSGSRTNRIEAEAVVREVVARLQAAAPGAAASIGVVTFSQAQQDLVENLLDAARAANPAVEAHFGADAVEPVFVKNLENVQGDERDVILFSIGYGPDPQGRVAMNFGPLNRQGGERRLNVAVTRARQALIVFSSLKPEQIDLSRTRAKGVADLKTFLQFAQRGPSALAAVHDAGGGAFESPFEEQVALRLRALGWTVHTQVGCSGYRIDLAVVDPAAAGRYLLGIECDGANYHRARTARDRDRLREQVLAGLGWTLHRIWSTDWWQDSGGQVAVLHERLQALAAEAAALAAPASPPIESMPAAALAETLEEPRPQAKPEAR